MRCDTNEDVERAMAARTGYIHLSALLSLFPDLPADATVETVLDRVREGERARRAWELLTARKGSVWAIVEDTAGDPIVPLWQYEDEVGRARNYDAPLAAVLAAADAQGDKP